MFSNTIYLKKHTPENGVDRENYLSLLVDEYLNSKSFDAQSQVLANLANFAYDPINYKYIRDVGVLDIFLYVLKNESNEKLLHYASAGICNLCLDPVNVEYILKYNGLRLIVNLLVSDHNETVANAVTTLLYMCDDQIKTEIESMNGISRIQDLEKSIDPRLANLAKIFLQNVCKITSTTNQQ